MALKARESNVIREFKTASSADLFIQAVEKTRLTDLSLDELANRYLQIDTQSHMMKGLILLEARSRFPSNNDFGDWVKNVFTLCEDAAPVRNRLMRYADFFKDRDQSGISLTACYAISSQDKPIAEEVYAVVKGKDLPVDEVKQIIRKTKGIPELKTPPAAITKHQVANKIINLVNQLDEADAIEVLERCLRMVRHEDVEVGAKTVTGKKRFRA